MENCLSYKRDYRNRIYSADLGRFVQTDPIRFDAGDVNIYRYVFNNPLRWTDPMGLKFTVRDGLNIAAGVIGAGATIVAVAATTPAVVVGATAVAAGAGTFALGMYVGDRWDDWQE